MALSYNWNSLYESLPTIGLSRSSLDDVFRKLTRGVREVMEREHNFGPFTEKDDGTHIPGKTTVLIKGDSTERDGLTNVEEGSLYLLDNGSFLQLQAMVDSSWEPVGQVDHGSLGGLLDDDHTQYMKKEDQNLNIDFDMDGNALLVPPAPSSKGFSTVEHHKEGHSSLGNIDAIEKLGRAELPSVQSVSISGSADKSPDEHNGEYYAEVDIEWSDLLFMPNVYAFNKTSEVYVELFISETTDGLVQPTIGTLLSSLVLVSSDSFDYRINYRYIDNSL